MESTRAVDEAIANDTLRKLRYYDCWSEPTCASGGGASSGGGKSFSCTTKSGDECPKKIKEQQSKLMSANKFLKSGKSLKIDVDGNTLTGDPRSFQSGNLGWYLTGKVEIEVGGQTVWAQVGMNVTIPGSSTWKR